MSTVYVVNQPMRLDEASGTLAPSLDLSSAAEFGHLQDLLPPGELGSDSDSIVRALQAGLKNFTSDDFLLLVGDPRAIAWSAAIAADATDGNFAVLRWLRGRRRYVVERVALWPNG